MNGEKIEILCIDDDPDDLEIFGEAVGQLALKTDVRNIMTGIELSQYFQLALVPDVIFLDGSVTSHRQQNCLDEIKSQKHLINTPVIILSTVGGENKVNEMYKRGAVLFLIKPSTLSELSSLLEIALTINWAKDDLERIKERFSEGHPEMKFPKIIPAR